GLRDVFPYIKGIPAYSNGLTVVASMEPLRPCQRDLFVRRYDEGRALLDGFGIANGLAGLEKLVAMGDQKLAELSSHPPAFRNSDDMPALEFRRLPGRLGLFYSNN